MLSGKNLCLAFSPIVRGGASGGCCLLIFLVPVLPLLGSGVGQANGKLDVAPRVPSHGIRVEDIRNSDDLGSDDRCIEVG
jgi:hypothetical protein